MLSNLKAALILTCLFALSVDALRESVLENMMKKRRQMLHMKRDFPLPPPVKRYIPVNYATLPIDHFGGHDGTFQNRYWYDATYYKPGGPVFLNDIGESNAEPFGAELAYDGDFVHTAIMRLAKRYNGVAVVWEHRYYGESLPFPVGHGTTKEQWQFHTVEQALEDVIYFAQRFSFPHPDSYTTSYRPHPSTTPWIFLGGSYPGIRAAFIRIRNPETIYASWASSAPVEAQIDMSSYWQAAERALPRNCSNDWVAVTKYVDDVLTNGNSEEVRDLKTRIIAAEFTGPGGNTAKLDQLGYLNIVDQFAPQTLVYYLMDPLGHYQVNGLAPILSFCEVMETSNGTGRSYSGGLAERFGVKSALDAFLTGLAETDPDIFAIAGPPGTEEADALSWKYQYCTEFGFFQGASPHNNRSIQSKFLTQEGMQADCLISFPAGAVPFEPNVHALNYRYGGWNMNPSHVFFTNGQIDPWRTLSIASFEDNAPKRVGRVSVPACHTAPDPSSYFGLVHRGKTHVKDFFSVFRGNYGAFVEPEEAFYTSLALFEMALDEWLPCFLR